MLELARLPADDETLLRRALPEGLPADARGLFPAGGWLRRVSGEGAVLFGGGAALLLEVAHPGVAAGVARHSEYRRDPYGRLSRTLAAVNAMVFGDVREALAATRRVEAAHARVHGRLERPVGAWPAGSPYHGRDVEAVRWVWATLAETARRVYERFVAPLPDAALDAYHAEHAVLARLLGIPPERAPASHVAFRAMFDGIVGGDALAVGPEAHDIARTVLDPPPGVAALAGGRLRAVTAALLPAPVREAYGLAWDAEREARFAAWAAGVRALRPGGAPGLDAAGGTR